MASPHQDEQGSLLHKANGSITKHDEKTHLPLCFHVPPGTDWLDLRFDYRPVQPQPGLPHNEISISLFDPLGCRGTRHNNRQLNVLLTPAGATPGFSAAPVTAGGWCVVIDIHRVIPGSVVTFDLTVRGGAGELTRVPAWVQVAPNAPRSSKRRSAPPAGPAGWYRGDLHAHSLHSDAAWDIPDLIEAAQHEGLDFVTLSDHNTVSGLGELRSYARPDLVTIGGMELSTFRGHALALGLDGWQEWRTAPHDGPATSPVELFARVERQAQLLVMAHPMSIGSPWRSGSLWEYADLMPGSFRCTEVWNGSWSGDSHNEQALQLFYLWLNQGHRLVATSGTDSHAPWQPGDRIAFNHVWAEELSEKGILAGLERGASYISDGPRLEVLAHGGLESGATSQSVGLGGTLKASARGLIEVQWEGCSPGDEVRLVREGAAVASARCPPIGSCTFELPAVPKWFTLEVRNAEQHLRAVTNPIYGPH